MSMYDVVWTIEVTADNETDAVRVAREVQLDPDSLATIFLVKGYFETNKVSDKELQKRGYRQIDLQIDLTYPEEVFPGENVQQLLCSKWS